MQFLRKSVKFSGCIIWPTVLLIVNGCSSPLGKGKFDNPPRTEQIVQTFSHHHINRSDAFHWLSQERDSKVLQQIEQENLYALKTLTHYQEQRKGKTALQSFGSGFEPSVILPVCDMSWTYRIENDSVNSGNCIYREKEASKELLFNPNKYKSLRGTQLTLTAVEPSPDGRQLLIGLEIEATGQHKLFIVKLDGHEGDAAEINCATSGAYWSADSQYLFYIESNAENGCHQLMKKEMNPQPGMKWTLFEEADASRKLRLTRTASNQYLVLDSYDQFNNELSLMPIQVNDAAVEIIIPRSKNLLCALDHQEDRFFIHSSHESLFRGVYASRLPKEELSSWSTIIAPQPGVHIVSVVYPLEHIVVKEQANYRELIYSYNLYNQEKNTLASVTEDKFCTLLYRPGQQFNVSWAIQSPLQPVQIWTCDLLNQKVSIPVNSPDSNQLLNQMQVRHLQATSVSGEILPVVFYHRKGLSQNAQNAAVLVSQHSGNDPGPKQFSSKWIAYFEQGISLAVACAKMESQAQPYVKKTAILTQRQESVYDFIACAEQLINQRWVHPDRLAAEGSEDSAWSIAATINLRPSLFACVILKSPLTDPISLLYDNSNPSHLLWQKTWGDISNQSDYDNLMKLSPYDQIDAKDYPAILIISTLGHVRVPYWQALKWGSKLRLLNTATTPVMMFTFLDHFENYTSQEKLNGLQLAFLLKQLAFENVWTH